MTGPPITAEERQNVADWIASQGKTANDVGRGAICQHFGISDRRARTILEELRLTWEKWVDSKPDPQPQSVPGESHDIKGDAWTISLPKTRIHTLEQLLEYCQVDADVWDVERFVVNKWEVGAKNKADQIVVEPLFQVKAWLKRNRVASDAKTLIADFVESAKKHAPVYKPFRYKPTSGNLLQVDVFDAHFGKFAWGEETGYADYDLHEAGHRLHEGIETLISRTQHHGIDKIIFPVGNDLQQTDNRFGTTTSGTHVDTDSRFQKVFKAVHTHIVATADRLSAIAPVELIIVPGNHDELAAWSIGFALECWYRNSPNITVNNAPRLRKYHEWGKCMQMLTHGHKGKHKDYGLLMATEQPEMFGRTRYREAHVGHYHQDRLSEKYGVIVRILRALCPPDAWHSDSAYVGNHEGAEAFVWNKEEGLIATGLYTVQPRAAA